MHQPLQRTKVWDLPTRLFHWSLVVLIIAAYFTAELGLIDWHFRCGYTILTLVLFRILWGLFGSDTARFARFVKGPKAAFGHLAHFLRREPDREVGHNAAGGLMVLGLLALLLVQTGTGLFSNDGVFTEGPLAHFVGGLSDTLTGWHAFNFNLILVAVALHVAAVLAYAAFKGQDLVRPMVTGFKTLPTTTPAPRIRPAVLAVALLAVAAAAVWGLSRLG